MKTRLGISFDSKNAYLAYSKADPVLQVSDAFSVALGVNNLFGNLTVDEEKQLIKTSGVIKSTLKAKKIGDTELFVTLPDEYCSVRILKLPLVSEKEIISAIELQAEEFIPYPVDEANFDYQILVTDEKEREMSVLVVATYKKIAERLSNFILDCGLYPTSLEPQFISVIRIIFNGYFSVPQDLILLISAGDKSSQAAILDMKNKLILMMHDFNLGMNFFVKAIQTNLNVPAEDAEKQLATMKTSGDLYEKIISPLFAEYSKEVQKILIASTEKISLMPKALYVMEPDPEGVITNLFKNSTLMLNNQTFQITAALFDAKSPLKFAATVDKTKLTMFVGSIATSI
ncbi:MAG: pilus assembly protein PilM [Patescibacteria group bacterium]|jgi:Tfp pilus assembly PilM family ATPase